MEIRIIRGVYKGPQDIKPIGCALLDEKGDIKKCPNCKEGTLFFEWETGMTKCTICDYLQY
jgi:uncharacterized protein (DUF983 family)